MPARPLTYQSSLMVTSDVGTMKSPWSTSLPSSSNTMPPEQQPVRAFATRAERPDTLEAVAVGRASGLAAWPDDGRHDCVGVAAVDVVLSLLGEVRRQPRVGVHHARQPTQSSRNPDRARS